MKNKFLASVAAVTLFATTGLVVAQNNPGGMKGGDTPAAASPKGETSAPMNAPAAKGAETAPTAPKSGASAQDNSDTKAKPKAAQDKAGSAGTKTPEAGSDAKTSSDAKGDSKSKTTEPTTSTTNSKDTKAPAAADSKPSTPNTKTSGNAATSATGAPPAEKQTQIISAIKQEKVEEVTNINFNISIGTAVPSTVRYYPLPSRIVEIYPEWHGYDFILVRGKYIILRPRTHEIVYIIEG
ncbi:DUF1236 domain-containing protein [Nitrobacter sp. JJSN]|uniref:DUF1236 domain-containing protein n=1 Tax=Nitrobacter sp. JJSN TaxID=3453033 RepID=UPI003F766A48